MSRTIEREFKLKPVRLFSYKLTTLLILFFIYFASRCFTQSLTGTIETHSFIGAITGSTVLYNIYLPEGYATTTTRYPVIYHLGGLGDTPSGHNTTICSSFEFAQDSGVIGPVIIVFPNSYGYTFWADSIDSTKPAETNVIYELIPHIDSTYRTLNEQRYRVVQGWSMGGFGAALYFTKYPELFQTAIFYDGALFPWSTMTTELPDTTQAIFGNNEAYFNQYSPWVFAANNASILQQSTSIRMVVAANTSYNRDYRDYLNSLSIYPAYVETTSVHIVAEVFAAEGYNSAVFIANRFNASSGPTNVDRHWQLYTYNKPTTEDSEKN
jgi:enterochelin esterase-like enzyme